MRSPSLIGLLSATLAACAGPAKDDAKGQVDESQPPTIPTESGKADTTAKIVAVNVQSPHPYANNANRLFAVSMTALPSCAKTARVHFRILRTEADYDFVTVEPVGEPRQEFTGTHDNTWTAWFDVNASYANVRLESDYSITRHGFEIDQIEWDGAPDNCPQIAATPCAAGTVDLSRAPGACECPVAPQCEPIANVEVEHQLSRGFDNTTKAVHGATALFTHPGPADAPETDTIGTVDTTQLAALVRRAAAQGLLHGPGYQHTVPAGEYRERFTIRAGTYEVSFVAAQGAQTTAVQQLIAELEALFTCGGGGLTCGANYECEQGACIQSACVCTAQYDPVCGNNGRTYGNACEASCASVDVAHDGECGIVGDMCGGFAGFACSGDNRCRYAPSTFDAPFPDASGTCVAPNYCDAPTDCNHLPHIAVPGAWACASNACAWHVGLVWQPLANWHFETAHPYGNNTSVWKQLYLPSGSQAMRLRASQFRTEAGYDKLEVWTWRDGAWAKITTYSGTTAPAVTDEFAGQYHYLRFVSDSSIVDAGVSVDADYR